MKTISSNFFSSVPALLLCAAFSHSQVQGQSTPVLTVQDPPKLVVKRADSPDFTLKVSIRPGYHANSNTPSEEYLIPMKLTWDSAGPLQPANVTYPKPKKEKFSFSETPLSIFDGDFEIVTRFQRPPNPPLGPGFITGKLRYQACNDKMCLPPKTVEIKLPVLLQ